MRETILLMISSRKSLAVYLNMEGKDLQDVHDENLGTAKKETEEDTRRCKKLPMLMGCLIYYCENGHLAKINY